MYRSDHRRGPGQERDERLSSMSNTRFAHKSLQKQNLALIRNFADRDFSEDRYLPEGSNAIFNKDRSDKFIDSVPNNLYHKGANVNVVAPPRLVSERNFETLENKRVSRIVMPNIYVGNSDLNDLAYKAIRRAPPSATMQDLVLQGNSDQGYKTSDATMNKIDPGMLTGAQRQMSVRLLQASATNKAYNEWTLKAAYAPTPRSKVRPTYTMNMDDDIPKESSSSESQYDEDEVVEGERADEEEKEEKKKNEGEVEDETVDIDDERDILDEDEVNRQRQERQQKDEAVRNTQQPLTGTTDEMGVRPAVDEEVEKVRETMSTPTPVPDVTRPIQRPKNEVTFDFAGALDSSSSMTPVNMPSESSNPMKQTTTGVGKATQHKWRSIDVDIPVSHTQPNVEPELEGNVHKSDRARPTEGQGGIPDPHGGEGTDPDVLPTTEGDGGLDDDTDLFSRFLGRWFQLDEGKKSEIFRKVVRGKLRKRIEEEEKQEGEEGEIGSDRKRVRFS